jgi:type I restriction-modification system DNA methylase subunit
MFTIATTNMILRGDGKSNLINEDFLKQDANKLQLKGSTVGMMNPPYSQGSKQNPDLYEIAFTEHLLDSLTEGARCAVIVPQSSMTGKTKEEQSIKENILKHHTFRWCYFIE